MPFGSERWTRGHYIVYLTLFHLNSVAARRVVREFNSRYLEEIK